MFLVLLQSDLLKAKERRYVQGPEADHHTARRLMAAPPRPSVLSINRAHLGSATENSGGYGEISTTNNLSLSVHLFAFAGKFASWVLQYRDHATSCMRCNG